MLRTRCFLVIIACGFALASLRAGASDLHLHLTGSGALTHKLVHFSCDSAAGKMGLPSGTFDVEYINGAGNSLAVLPINGRSLIFANVLSASGARYAADRYIWSDGGPRGAFLSSDALDGHAQTLCRSVK